MSTRTLHRFGGLAMACALTVTPFSARADDEAPASARTVHVRLAGGKRVSLEQANADGTWREVCRATCGEDVPVEATYRVREGSHVTDTFRLVGDAREVELEATTNTIVDIGMSLTIAGSSLWSVIAMTDLTTDLDKREMPGGARAGFMIGAGVVALAGVVVLLVGMSQDRGVSSKPVPTAAPSPPRASSKGGVSFDASGLVLSF